MLGMYLAETLEEGRAICLGPEDGAGGKLPVHSMGGSAGEFDAQGGGTCGSVSSQETLIDK
jgi:hypothetical protein